MDTNALREALLGKYEVRKTEKQKTVFIDWVTEYAQSQEIPVAVEESRQFVYSRNIVFGDADKARVIMTAHYDTCARMLLLNFSTPGNLPLFIAEQTILTLLIALGGWLAGWGAGVLLDGLMHPFAAGLLSVLAALLGSVLVLGLMLAGPANPHTANDNTSGVLLILMAMQRFKEKLGVAFVLLDNEEKGMFGSLAFMKAHPQAARRFLINFDCVGDGDTLLFTGMKGGMRMPQAKRMMAAMEEVAPGYAMKTVSGEFPKWIYPSDQMLFPRGTAFSALKGKRVLYLDRIHTARDTVLEQRNVDCLLDVLEKSAL